MAATTKKILCIEDEHFIGELYTRALKKAGYEIAVVPDGSEGLKAALSNTYDIILLDLMVPGITGMDILRQLRQKTDNPIRAKIVITTNLEVKDGLHKELENMADGYIIKAEITPHQLVDFVNQIKTSGAPS